MSEKRFLRFSGFHRVLHWLIAIPYMTLLASGAILVLQHIGWLKSPPTNLIATLHRWVGLAFTAIVLQLILAAFVAGHWRAIGGDFRDWFIPRRRDLLWLTLVPLNSFFPKRFPLPPAGRFNAGQKLHGLFILIAVTGFIITGLLMILIHGWLRIWLIHTWLFFGAAAFLSLHLFLALINPTTRRALSGILTGHVSHTYVAEHHVLELEAAPLEHEPHAAVSIRAVVVALLPIAIVMLVWWRGPGKGMVQAAMAPSQEDAFLSPGDLISPHAIGLRDTQCDTCHSHSGVPGKSACLVCHVEIRKALDHSAGYHGTFTQYCATCHKEHCGVNADLRNFAPRTFNHQLAAFPLRGAHLSLACDQCHVAHSPTPGVLRYIGVKSAACTDCHSNPHVDTPAANCARCHTEQGWKGRDLLFVHNRDTDFKLDATHAALSCTACHKSAEKTPIFHGLATTCEQCHAGISNAMAGKIGASALKPDPHNGRVACIECHTPNVANATPAQFAAQCERCHGVRYRTLFFNWQKSLDEQEQSAWLRLRQHAGGDSKALEQGQKQIHAAHDAGMHNVQQAIETFEQIGK